MVLDPFNLSPLSIDDKPPIRLDYLSLLIIYSVTWTTSVFIVTLFYFTLISLFCNTYNNPMQSNP